MSESGQRHVWRADFDGAVSGESLADSPSVTGICGAAGGGLAGADVLGVDVLGVDVLGVADVPGVDALDGAAAFGGVGVLAVVGGCRRSRLLSLCPFCRWRPW
jgi:hypothetical protein